MKTRNPNATCGNCPYWLDDAKPDDKDRGLCCRTAELRYGDNGYGSIAMRYEWCGEHPDFEVEETDLSAVAGAHPDLPDLEHPDPNEATS